MADHPITSAVQDEAWKLLERLNQFWTPTLGYFEVDTDTFVAVILFLEAQGIGVEPPTSANGDDDLTAAEESDMMQFAANALVDLIRANTEGEKSP